MGMKIHLKIRKNEQILLQNSNFFQKQEHVVD